MAVLILWSHDRDRVGAQVQEKYEEMSLFGRKVSFRNYMRVERVTIPKSIHPPSKECLILPKKKNYPPDRSNAKTKRNDKYIQIQTLCRY